MFNLLALSLGRVDWNIWKPILKILKKKNYKVFLAASAMHFEKKYGNSYKLILNEGLKINFKIKLPFKKSNPENINFQISNYIKYFTNIYKLNRFDFLIIIGDRFESLAAAIAALPFKIPIIHFHGGEITEGSLDNQYRNAITKLSHIHMTSNKVYKKRILQLGEEKWRVNYIGAPSLNNINSEKFLDKKIFFKKYNLDFNKDIFLVNFNSESINFEKTEKQIKTLFNVLIKFKEKNILVTKTNFDTYSNIINNHITNIKKKYTFVKLVSYLGEDYNSAMKYSKIMIGNSSSGIIEAASFKLPVVNIGIRQKGRAFAKNIINSDFNEVDILKAIKIAYSNRFKKKIQKIVNPYENKRFEKNLNMIMNKISKLNKNQLIVKKFIDQKI